MFRPMIASILTGLFAAIVVAFPQILRNSSSPHLSSFSSHLGWNAPIFILGVTALAMVLQRFFIDRKPGNRIYDGLADLFIHIHSLSSPDSASRWGMRGFLSFLLNLFGGTVGPEGAAVELTHGLEIGTRSSSSRWFEQRRRTDVATALAAGISAAFAAPFAAVLLTIELGIGGRTISAALSAIAAFFGIRLIGSAVSFGVPFDERLDMAAAVHGYRLGGSAEPGLATKEWLSIFLVTIGVGVASVVVIRFIRYCQESLLDLFQTETWMRTVAGGILLFLVIVVYKAGHAPSWHLLEQVLWSHLTSSEIILLCLTQLLTLALVLAAFGTVGFFWPLFVLGASLGFLFQQTGAMVGLVGGPGFSAVAALAGATALWGAILGAPLTGAVLAFEMTHNFNVLAPCFLAGIGAREVRRFLKTLPLLHKDLEARGLPLLDGRSATVLNSILVKDAMVTDHESVYEHEPISELHSRFLKSRHPFLPVVNRAGNYVGLLTIDMIQEGVFSLPGRSSNLEDQKLPADSPLSSLFEVKDLLYKTRRKIPTVNASAALGATSRIFDQNPCVAVVGEDGRVLGLLFAYNVRVAYDREVARRALSQRTSFK